MVVLNPTVPEASELTQKDVWGEWTEPKVGEPMRKLSDGMIVARSDQKCPVWGDKVPYKSVTVICKAGQVQDTIYWLEYVHGGGSVRKMKALPGDRVALRSDYMAW